MKTNPLKGLNDLGQSVWLDNLSRGLITSGRLGRYIQEDGITGITTNPTIFQNAISGRSDYDDLLKALISRNITDERELFFRLAMEDVAEAADMLMPVYESTDGLDGYVSIEVSPEFAHDTRATIKEAEYLFSAINRKNLLIKVPATGEGIPAIEYLISRGINVNVTLLFSVKRYEEVARAYIRGLTKRLSENEPIEHVQSVASFFVSRVDTLIDGLLAQRAGPEGHGPAASRIRKMAGKAAVLNAKKAYLRYRSIFSSEEFEHLRQRGARPQRVLWASTGTKNPEYSDIKYAEELVLPDTVNTMPESLIEKFRAHGRAIISHLPAEDEIDRFFSELNSVGIDIDLVSEQLEREGVEKFASSFREVLSELAKKRDALSGK